MYAITTDMCSSKVDIQCVVRDNASNISSGVRLTNFDDSIGCFYHAIHLIVTHAIYSQSDVKLMRTCLINLVKKLQTDRGKNLFNVYQQQAGVPQNFMYLSGETRWKSEYVKLERAEQQKEAIKLAEDDEELDLRMTAI